MILLLCILCSSKCRLDHMGGCRTPSNGTSGTGRRVDCFGNIPTLGLAPPHADLAGLGNLKQAARQRDMWCVALLDFAGGVMILSPRRGGVWNGPRGL